MSKQVKQPEIPPKPAGNPKAQLADKVKAMTTGSVIKKNG